MEMENKNIECIFSKFPEMMKEEEKLVFWKKKKQIQSVLRRRTLLPEGNAHLTNDMKAVKIS